MAIARDLEIIPYRLHASWQLVLPRYSIVKIFPQWDDQPTVLTDGRLHEAWHQT